MIKKVKKSLALVLTLVLICAYIPSKQVAVSESAATVSSVTAATTLTVSSQSALDAALKNQNLSSLTLKTSSEDVFTIAKGTYSKLSITINAPNATIINQAKVKKITIAGAKNYNEYVSGNTVEVTMKKAASKLKLTLAPAFKKTKIVNKSGKAIKFTNNTGEEKILKKGKKYTSKAVKTSDITVYSTVQPKSVSLSGTSTMLHVGEVLRIEQEFLPQGANSALSFSSSNESVATVDDYGYVTGMSKGKTVITGIASNGIYGTYCVEVTDNAPELIYKLNKDKSGYIVTGCKDKNAYMANIPAEYKGLPVVEVQGKAFSECDNLRFFTVDDNQKNFYTIDGILYAEKPVKTLVKIPNSRVDRYSEVKAIEVPKDTKAIGDYAFSGLYSYEYYLDIILPEGIESMGDYVFAGVRTQIGVFVPDSLNSIGKDIMLNQRNNVFFVGSWESYAAEYAEAHFIPFGGVFDWEIKPATAKLTTPVISSADGYKVPSDSKINKVYLDRYVASEFYYYVTDINVDSYRKSGYTETRFMMADSDCWKSFVPDKTGRTNSVYPDMTGIYGIGYTEGKTTLIGYDNNSKPIGMITVKGDFAFSFKDAASIGVVGGKNTTLQMIPYEPTFISSAGYVNLEPDKWIVPDKGYCFRYIIACYGSPEASMECPNYMNVVGYCKVNSLGKNPENENEHYILITSFLQDSFLKDQTDLIAWNFDSIAEIYNSDTLTCFALDSYKLDKDFGEKADELLGEIVKAMSGTYYPQKAGINKITIRADGFYPSTMDSTVYIDENCTDIENNADTLTHEMIHAIDQSIPYLNYMGPSVWMEGRAEYISIKVSEKLGFWYSGYPDEYDWSFLTDADKADFCHYMCYNMNRQTPYAVGYYFVKYISEKYGEDVSAKIMTKMAKIKVDDSIYNYTEEERADQEAQIFAECVTAVTSDTVFDDFVRDVVNK